SALALFVLGFCWLSPALRKLQRQAGQCTVLSVQQSSVACHSTILYPCLEAASARQSQGEMGHTTLTSPVLLEGRWGGVGWQRRWPEESRSTWAMLPLLHTSSPLPYTLAGSRELVIGDSKSGVRALAGLGWGWWGAAGWK
uniref:Uncharacterized protein n=1 Tax=Crocodylus porosus TaxID=8502 RepID=A0A7M4F529_CROPO